MSAIELNAKPSKDFAEKLTATIALLQHAAADYSPVTQASSLGDRKSTRLNSSHVLRSRMPSSA